MFLHSAMALRILETWATIIIALITHPMIVIAHQMEDVTIQPLSVEHRQVQPTIQETTGMSRSVASTDSTIQTHGCTPQLSWAATQSAEQTQVAPATGEISQETLQV